MDSNVFGAVPVGLVTARAQCVLWPPRRWRALDAQLPPDRSASLVSVRPYNGSYNSGQQFIIELKNAPPCHFDLSSFEENTRIEWSYNQTKLHFVQQQIVFLKYSGPFANMFTIFKGHMDFGC